MWFYIIISFSIASGLVLLGFLIRNAIVDQREDARFLKNSESAARRNADRFTPKDSEI